MKHVVTEITDCLLNGGIVLIPTDTVYGLAVSPKFTESVVSLYRLKSRPTNLNLPIMVSSLSQLESLGIDINHPAKQLLASPLVPGALTLAMGFVSEPLVPWLKGREEVAIRIPNDKVLLSALERTGPLYVTSANLHGASTSECVSDILSQLNGKPDKIIDGGVLSVVPSTLINCRCNPPVIERERSISRSEIEKYIDCSL